MLTRANSSTSYSLSTPHDQPNHHVALMLTACSSLCHFGRDALCLPAYSCLQPCMLTETTPGS
jgi:hypothetical protein